MADFRLKMTKKERDKLIEDKSLMRKLKVIQEMTRDLCKNIEQSADTYHYEQTQTWSMQEAPVSGGDS